jgi:hypothetical protein
MMVGGGCFDILDNLCKGQQLSRGHWKTKTSVVVQPIGTQFVES